MRAVIFFNYTATTAIDTYCHTRSLRDALPVGHRRAGAFRDPSAGGPRAEGAGLARSALLLLRGLSPAGGGGCRHHRLFGADLRRGLRGRGLGREDETRVLGRRRRRSSEEHTSELQSLLRTSYAVFCLKTTTTHLPQPLH